jgi:hypothetical protein
MVKNKLIILSFTTIIVIVAATIFANLRAPQLEKEKTPFSPELAKQIESVNYISIKGYSDSINLTRKNDIWGIDEFDGYPALPDKVKSTVLGVADLKINTPKTALPRLYHRLGVEGPEIVDTTSLLLTLNDSKQNKIIEVIVGKPRLSSSAQNTPGLYVRKLEEEKSYLVDGVLDISAIKTDWIKRSLFDIPVEAVKSVSITHADGDTYTLFKNEKGQEQFELKNIPIDKKLASELIINRFGTILQDLQINGAKSKEMLNEENNNIRLKITTFEGIIGDMVAFKYDDIAYASFKFSYDEEIAKNNGEEEVKNEDVKNFIANLNSDTENWWFEIPEFKYDIIKRHSNTITRDILSIIPKEVTE